MARIAVGCSITAGNSIPQASHRSDPVTASVAAIADQAAIDSDITAALANVTISGDVTASGLVTQIQTDFAALKTALAPATASTVVLSFDAAAVASKNMLRQCVEAIMRAVAGSNDLT